MTRKTELMARFDDVATDRRVTRQTVDAFVADPAMVGHSFLDTYPVATTSGTTGIRGFIVIDRTTLAVATTMGAHMFTSWLRPPDLARIIAGGVRTAMVSATGGHFASASAVAAASLRGTRRGARRVRRFAVHTPMSQLVAELNAFGPALLAPYATTATPRAPATGGRSRPRPALADLVGGDRHRAARPRRRGHPAAR